jgi:hypothetical protein
MPQVESVGLTSSGWTLTEEAALRGFSVEWAEPGRLILARRNELYEAAAPDARPRPLGRLDAGPWRPLLARIRPAQRALRFGFYNLLRLPDGTFFYTFDKGVGTWDGRSFAPLPGLVRPTRVLRGAAALDREGEVWFGEYVGNADRHEIHVYRYRPGTSRVEIAYTFPRGAVRHVHGIYADPFGPELWCVTGDGPPECRMLRTRDGFRSLETVSAGDESWRCVSLLFTPRGAYYGSDAEFVQNHLYFVDRTSLARTRLGPIDGPVYYTRALGDDLFFGVTAELCPSQTGKHASLWHLRDGERPHRMLTIPKDALPVRWFQPGTWQFARGPGLPDRLLVHLLGLAGHDNRTYSLRPGPPS